jgi:hypothetical protein
MALTFTESWTDNVEVLAYQIVQGYYGNPVGTLDLTGKLGAMVTIKIGRQSTSYDLTPYTTFIKIRKVKSDTDGDISADGFYYGIVQAAPLVMNTVYGGASAGAYEVPTSTVSGFAAGEWVSISQAYTVNRLEFARIAKLTVTSGTGITLDRPLMYSHPGGEEINGKAIVFGELWLDGGSAYEFSANMLAENSMRTLQIGAKARTLDAIIPVIV